MRLARRIALLAIIGLALGLVGAEPEWELRVVDDSSGATLSSVIIRLSDSVTRETTTELETDAQGRARAGSLRAGDYLIELSKLNYVSVLATVHLPARKMSIRMAPYGLLSGRVFDSNGGPVLGGARPNGVPSSAAIAVLNRLGGGEALSFIYRHGLSETGEYSIPAEPGEYVLAFEFANQHDGTGLQLYPNNAHPQVFRVVAGEEYRHIDFQISPAQVYSIAGHIAPPQPGLRFPVALVASEYPELPLTVIQADKEGNFRFDGIRPGDYDVLVNGPADQTGRLLYGRSRIRVTGLSIEGLEISLVEPRSFQLALRGRDNGPIPSGCLSTAALWFIPTEFWGTPARNVTASFGKETPVAAIAPGGFRIQPEDIGEGCYLARPATIDLSHDPEGPIVAEFESGGTLSGVLHADPDETRDMVVVLTGQGQPVRLALPDTKGRFTFDQLRPGPYRIVSRRLQEGSAQPWLTGTTDLADAVVEASRTTDIQLAIQPSAARGDRK